MTALIPHATINLTLARRVAHLSSPTRSAAQTGRNPIHVNTVNLDPYYYNPKDNVSGYSAVPRNMTGMGEAMKKAGYKTSFFGKW